MQLFSSVHSCFSPSTDSSKTILALYQIHLKCGTLRTTKNAFVSRSSLNQTSACPFSPVARTQKYLVVFSKALNLGIPSCDIKLDFIATMTLLQLQMIALLLLCQTVTAEETNSTVTFGAPPPINSSKIGNLGLSPADHTLIISEQQEVLDLEQFSLGAAPYTNITMKVLNRTAPNNFTQYLRTYPGSWVYVESSTVTFSCSAIFETASKTFGLMGFIRKQGRFQMLGQIPMSVMTNETNLTLPMIREMIVVSEDCQLLAFTNPSANVSTLLYRPINNYTNYTIVPYPGSWNLQTYSMDLLYAISNNKLYHYNNSTKEIHLRFTFPTAYQKYKIRNYMNRVSVQASNWTSINATLSMVKYYVFILVDQPSGMTLIDNLVCLDCLELGTGIGMLTSPLLTKVALGFLNQQYKLTTFARHVDYSTKTTITLYFQDLSHFANTIENVNLAKEFFMGDYFLAVRNGSKFNSSNPSKVPVEEGYQYVGNQIVFIRDRSLLNSTNNTELLGFAKLTIDQLFKQTLVTLNLYATSNTTFEIHQHVYGSLASVKRVADVKTPYVLFSEPAHDRLVSNAQNFHWIYIDDLPSPPQTNITGFIVDPTMSKNLRTSFGRQLNGTWQALVVHPKCIIATNNAVIQILAPPTSNNTMDYELRADITQQLSGITIDNTTKWAASIDCLRVRVANRLLASPPPPANISLTAVDQFLSSWRAVDSNISIVVASDSSLWRFNPTTRQFVKIYTPSSAFPSGDISIRADVQSFVVWGTSNGSAWVRAFTNNTQQIVQILDYSQTGFSNIPEVHISPNLTKILIVGSTLASGASTSAPSVTSYFLDFKNTTSRNISFPSEHFLPGTYITLGDSFLYLRQLPSLSKPQELIFYFARDMIPVLLSKKDVSSVVNVDWVKALIVSDPLKGHFLMTETVEGSSAPKNRVVRTYELVGNEQDGNAQDNPTYTVEYSNGSAKLCPPGCADCSCSSCLQGYVLDSTKGSCRKCAPGCLSCSLQDQTSCSSCAPGSFLNSSSNCQPCSSNCIACNASTNACTQCYPGKFFQSSSQTCKSCPKNCYNCSSSSVCLTCVKGFTLTADNQCMGCSTKCTSCSATDITKCTGCGQGLQLINDACVQCSDSKCLECKDSLCAVCISGYSPDTNGKCVIKCKLPCLTCKENEPSSCLTCQSGSKAVNNTCILDQSCNTYQNCSNCGQGLNFILVPTASGAICQSCPNISNCLQCDQINTYTCSICKRNYFPNSTGLCQPCNSNCTSCQTSSTCTGCLEGYTLPQGFTEGVCLKCQPPCKTCQGSPTYCTSCNGSYTRQNSKCRNNTYIKFKFTVNGNQADVLQNINKIVKGLLKLLGEDQSKAEAVNFETIKSGSTVLSGTLQPSASTSLARTSSTLAQQLATSGIPGTSYSVSGIDVQAQGTSSNESSSESSSNTGLIIGIVVGVVAAVIIAVIVVLVVRKKKQQAAETTPGGSDLQFDAVIAGPQKVRSDSADPYTYTPDIEKQF